MDVVSAVAYDSVMDDASPSPAHHLDDVRLARIVSLATAVVTVVTFAAALVAVPVSGANCPGDCLTYPYLDSLHRYPRDYVWMYVAVVQSIVSLLFVVALRAIAPTHRATLAQMAVVVATAATTVLASTYFVQASVVPASLEAGETEGITLLTQYNPHGLFVALEEIGYLLAAVSFALLAPAIGGAGRRVVAVRVLFALALPVMAVALAGYSVAYGLDRQDRFEVVAVSVVWLVLIVNGALLTSLLGARLRTDR